MPIEPYIFSILAEHMQWTTVLFRILLFIVGTLSLIYKCFDKNSDTETDNENCKLLEDPTGDPVECIRVQCNADL